MDHFSVFRWYCEASMVHKKPLSRPVGPALLPLFIAIHSQPIRFVAFRPRPTSSPSQASAAPPDWPGRLWQHGPEVQELEAQIKAQQVYEQTNGQAVWSLGAAFWELRFPKG